MRVLSISSGYYNPLFKGIKNRAVKQDISNVINSVNVDTVEIKNIQEARLQKFEKEFEDFNDEIKNVSELSEKLMPKSEWKYQPGVRYRYGDFDDRAYGSTDDVIIMRDFDKDTKQVIREYKFFRYTDGFYLGDVTDTPEGEKNYNWARIVRYKDRTGRSYNTYVNFRQLNSDTAGQYPGMYQFSIINNKLIDYKSDKYRVTLYTDGQVKAFSSNDEKNVYADFVIAFDRKGKMTDLLNTDNCYQLGAGRTYEGEKEVWR